jgi:antirestriction protein ArdC
MPKNLISKREYRGINVFLLASRGYGSPYWLTYKQATEQGGNVRRGEHGSKVVFWKIDKYETEDADGQTLAKSSAILRYYTVFNVEQCQGITAPGSIGRSAPLGNTIRLCSTSYSTGHPSRIGREGIERLNTFGSESYSKEELIAEMGAAMLAGIAGIERRTLANSAAYLQSWIDVLKSDSRMVVFAASQAQKAADYIQGVRP